MSDESITDLLERLSSGRVDAAWREFLALYSPAIMRVIRRHVADDERAAECFAHVCGALSDTDFHRLRGYRPDGPARFTTWLMAVVANLCVDWRRKVQGRVRPFLTVSRLPELDQQVFRSIFVSRMSRAQCLEALAPRFPGLNSARVAEINARLFVLLTPQQRWQLSARGAVLHPGVPGAASDHDDPSCQVATPDPGPDEVAAESQELGQLREALSKLPAEQRLLLRLRYEQGMTLAEVARLTGQPDPFRANRRIQSALDALAALMDGRQPPRDRKT